ncbi:translation initiation factor 2D [Fistulifera solaris]|uniref:Translation initiation factor 2D n=1 Tax=Fistulifera solaris TaxID=1519565 RepID=A0A1Z5JZQ3_FISSO|nr:translation initiation factor 2D [Fistulifera solaris]|eukprot:GAX19520.1 translation initiation factor 2D [Fistulifera solaris]
MFHKANSSILSNPRKDASKKAKDVPLRKSDRKNLRLRAASMLNCDDESLLDLCFLEGTLFSRQMQLPDAKATLYFRSAAAEEEDTAWPYHYHSQCIWIELDSKTLVPGNSNKPEIIHVPTVTLLSLLPPGSLPEVRIHPEASKFVCRGADLMKPGIRGWRPPVKQQSQAMLAVAVAVNGNSQPLAVGLLAQDLMEDFMTNVKTSGVGVTIVTAYGDDLWKNQLPPSLVDLNSLSLFDGGHYGNAGFVDGKFVAPIDSSGTDDGTDDGDSQASVEEKDEEKRAEETDADVASNGDSHEKHDTDDENGEEAQDDQASPDDILHAAVCKALSMLQAEKKKLLPMRMATFYAQHVIPNRQEGTSIELKRTKYKKFSAYVAEQVENGLLFVGVSQEGTRKDPMGMLIDFDVRHSAIQDFIVLRKASEANKPPDTKDKRLVLTHLYCIPHHFQALLRLDSDAIKASNATSDERRGTDMLTLKEIRSILDDYIDRENLVDPSNRNMIVIDGPLKDALYKQKKQSDNVTSIPTHIPRKDIITAWTAKMESAFALVEVPGNKVIRIGRGQAPCVTIEVSRRQSNKFATEVRGYEEFGLDAETLCHEISQRFACAAKIVTTQSSSKRASTELLIQGNLAQELEALLTGDVSKTKHGGAKDSPYCLPKNSIQKVLRKGVPAKGKK